MRSIMISGNSIMITSSSSSSSSSSKIPRILSVSFSPLSILLLLLVPSTHAIPQQGFAIEPQDRTAVVGETIILSCRVVNKVGTLQWTKDSFGLGTERELAGYPRYSMAGNDEEGDYSLHIRDVNLDDDATFECQVGGADGVRGIRSRAAVLTVFVPPEPPKIVECDSLKTKAGVEVTLTCESGAGKPPAGLTWIDGEGYPVPSEEVVYTRTPMPDGKRENAVLKWTFKPTKDHDGKTFTCRSENPALTQPQKAHIKLEVEYPPDVTLTIDKEHVVEGDRVRFKCTSSANPKDVIFKWYKNEEAVVGDHTSSYTITKVGHELHDVTITCEVSNAVGTTRASHVMNVHFGPVFLRPLTDVKVVSNGSEVKLTCDVSGNPQPDIIWLFENSPRVLSTDPELVIPEINYESAGKYVCRASVLGFPEISASTQVFIKGPPRVTSAPTQYGSEGEIIKVECLVQSVPLPSRVSWSRNMQNVDVDNNLGYELIEEKLESGSTIRNLLVIHNPKRDDFGTYNCSAQNEFGSDFMTITLAKQKTNWFRWIPANVHMTPTTIIISVGVIVFVVVITVIIITIITRTKRFDSTKEAGDDEKNKRNSDSTIVVPSTGSSSDTDASSSSHVEYKNSSSSHMTINSHHNHNGASHYNTSWDPRIPSNTWDAVHINGNHDVKYAGIDGSPAMNISVGGGGHVSLSYEQPEASWGWGGWWPHVPIGESSV